jgi:hypothetical protein
MSDEPPVAEGMMEVWTVERQTVRGVFIDALHSTREEAEADLATRGPQWSSRRLVVPYGKKKEEE